MSTEALRSVTDFYTTNLQTKIDSYDKVADRIAYSLGYPMINIELHRNQIYEFIGMAAEMFTKFAGYTEEYLIFDSNLYDVGKGIRLDKLFTITPELTSVVEVLTPNSSLVNPKSRTTLVLPGVDYVVYEMIVDDANSDPVEFTLKMIETATRHVRASKMFLATQFSVEGNASYTEFGVVNTSPSETVTFSVASSGLSGRFIQIIATPTVSGTVTVIANDIINGATDSVLYNTVSAIPSYDSLISNYRKVISVNGFEEGSSSGINTLFTVEQSLAQQTYFSYAMGNYGFDLISWYTVKEFIELRERLFAQKRSYKFDPRTQYLSFYPSIKTGDVRFYGIISCYVERALVDVIKEPWVYQYALALSKIGIGRIRGKYSGTSLFGGGQVSDNGMLAEGLDEKKTLEQKLYEGTPGFGDAAPPMFFVG